MRHGRRPRIPVKITGRNSIPDRVLMTGAEAMIERSEGIHVADPGGNREETIPSSSRCHDRRMFSTISGPDAAISGGNTGGIEVAAMGAPIPAFVGGISAMNRALHWGVARLMRWRISSMRPSGAGVRPRSLRWPKCSPGRSRVHSSREHYTPIRQLNIQNRDFCAAEPSDRPRSSNR